MGIYTFGLYVCSILGLNEAQRQLVKIAGATNGEGSLLVCRPEAKPSVFDRLEKAPAAERDSSSLRQKVPGSRSKMRMDAIPSSKPETVEQLHDSDPEEPSTAKLLAPSASLVRLRLL